MFFCLNFAYLSMAAWQKLTSPFSQPQSLGPPYFVLVRSPPIASQENDIQKWICLGLLRIKSNFFINQANCASFNIYKVARF